MSGAVHGVLVVDKPGGMTSHDVVAGARRLFGTRAVGHAGTLDPMATGVLVLLFGEACKLSAYLTGQNKTYRAGVRFGKATDSLDADGRVTEERTLPGGWLAESALERALDVERARTLQVPPAVSAISEGGRRAYERVRAGETVELAARPVRVARLELLEWSDAGAAVELEASKGYYVRAFARDLGATLGVPAHLESLRRLASGAFSLRDAHAWPPPSPLPGLVPTVEAARRALPTTHLSSAATVKARRGQALAANEVESTAGPNEISCWLSPEGELVALGMRTDAGVFRVVRGMRAQS
ncbi:MAG TPA: tRNA pseudouridine(55) synthase TruB [Polyangiaceae bacterium]|nr:tRNA pseudouridine(55) synthase TruB [Polyangiaceae bacterium]